MLYLVSTPIGNLKDITYRAVETLKSVDYVLCEDTRHSAKLFQAYGIETKRISFHQFSEKSKEQAVIDDLKNGLSIALISDAGTPAIADPGERLVKRCYLEKLKVVPIPGSSAVITALSASGLSTNKFLFIGFLPKKNSELKAVFDSISTFDGTVICYESPYRLKNVLEHLKLNHPSFNLTVARELTKIHEEFRQGKADELLAFFEEREIKGEIVLLIEPKLDEEHYLPTEDEIVLLVEKLQKELSLTLKLAINEAALKLHLPKRVVYSAVHCRNKRS